jgi:hypothetical protein
VRSGSHLPIDNRPRSIIERYGSKEVTSRSSGGRPGSKKKEPSSRRGLLHLLVMPVTREANRLTEKRFPHETPMFPIRTDKACAQRGPQVVPDEEEP